MKKNKTIRFDDRTWMLLNELSERTGESISVIVRSMVLRNIETWLDITGNWKLDAYEKEKE